MAGAPADDPIFRQIETSADYYPVGTYVFGPGTELGFEPLLTFYRNLEVTEDPLGSEYVPLSSVAQRGRNPKIFAVGILPPNQVVTERLLDRTRIRLPQSTDLYLGGPSQEDLAREEPLIEEDPRGLEMSRDAGASEPLPASVIARNDHLINGLHGSIQPLIRELIRIAAQEGIQLVVTEGVRSEARQQELYDRGRTNDKPKVTNALPGNSWHQYGLAADVAIVKNAKGQPHWPPDLSLWGRIGAIGESLGLRWGGNFDLPDRPHFEYHPGFHIQQAKAGVRPPIPPPGPNPVLADTLASPFLEGSRFSARHSKIQGKMVGTDVRVRDRSLELQQSQAKVIKSALHAMANTPPLRMLINPSKFSVKSQKIGNSGNWGRRGPILQFWGDDQDKISGSGKVAGFYAVEAFGRGGPGLTRHARNFSQSWQNFMALFMMYRSNGGVFLNDLGQANRDLLLSTVGSVYIYYDNIIYIGSFDSFGISESDGSPFTVDYNFEFTVRASFLLEYPDEYNYGAPSMFTQRRST